MNGDWKGIRKWKFGISDSSLPINIMNEIYSPLLAPPPLSGARGWRAAWGEVGQGAKSPGESPGLHLFISIRSFRMAGHQQHHLLLLQQVHLFPDG